MFYRSLILFIVCCLLLCFTFFTYADNSHYERVVDDKNLEKTETEDLSKHEKTTEELLLDIENNSSGIFSFSGTLQGLFIDYKTSIGQKVTIIKASMRKDIIDVIKKRYLNEKLTKKERQKIPTKQAPEILDILLRVEKNQKNSTWNLRRKFWKKMIIESASKTLYLRSSDFQRQAFEHEIRKSYLRDKADIKSLLAKSTIYLLEYLESHCAGEFSFQGLKESDRYARQYTDYFPSENEWKILNNLSKRKDILKEIKSKYIDYEVYWDLTQLYPNHILAVIDILLRIEREKDIDTSDIRKKFWKKWVDEYPEYNFLKGNTPDSKRKYFEGEILKSYDEYGKPNLKKLTTSQLLDEIVVLSKGIFVFGASENLRCIDYYPQDTINYYIVEASNRKDIIETVQSQCQRFKKRRKAGYKGFEILDVLLRVQENTKRDTSELRKEFWDNWFMKTKYAEYYLKDENGSKNRKYYEQEILRSYLRDMKDIKPLLELKTNDLLDYLETHCSGLNAFQSLKEYNPKIKFAKYKLACNESRLIEELSTREVILDSIKTKYIYPEIEWENYPSFPPHVISILDILLRVEKNEKLETKNLRTNLWNMWIKSYPNSDNNLKLKTGDILVLETEICKSFEDSSAGTQTKPK